MAVGVDMDGCKDVLGLWVGAAGESSTTWTAVLSELRNRGIDDVCGCTSWGVSGRSRRPPAGARRTAGSITGCVRVRSALGSATIRRHRPTRARQPSRHAPRCRFLSGAVARR
ncbi:transposase [Streptomyces sp. 11x1]|nr:transposase [Streptomyces sp. 11x1]